MKDIMLKRIPLTMLLAIQVLGGGAVTLAHARDVVAAPPAVEASHDARCAILHDELRCALCHYAGARILASQQVFLVPATPGVPVSIRTVCEVISYSDSVRSTLPARAPPLSFS
jgi:hypothetical protein